MDIDKATANMIENLKEKTGKSLEQWIGLAKACGLSKHLEIVNHLKKEHGLGHGYANLVAHRMRAAAEPAGKGEPDLVEAQYAGDKAGLKPIYDRLIEAVQAFGGDVELAPKKAYVSLRRSKQFGLIQPTTKARMDIGIQLKGVEPTDRLEASGSFNAMVSHRVRVSSLAEVDKQLIGWLRQAYDAA